MDLKDLFISKVRVKLLEAFLSKPDQLIHVRGLVRATDEQINAVRRELARMDRLGMVDKERRGNRLYYWFRKDYPLYFELLHLIAKTTGFGKTILKNKNKIGKIKFACLSGSLARGVLYEKDKIDLLIVGQVVLPELSRIIKDAEGVLEREINYAVMTKEEFDYKKKRGDPFVSKTLLMPRVMLIGDEQEMTESKIKDYTD